MDITRKAQPGLRFCFAYNPQNETFMFFGTKRIKSQNETYLCDTPLKNKKAPRISRGAFIL